MNLPPPLVALSPGDLDEQGARAFEIVAARAFDAGLRGLLLRESGLTDRAWLELATRLRERFAGAWLGAHDRAHLAQACGADTVHLGWRSLRPAEIRTWLPGSIAIGLSTHAHDDPASWSGADYLFHGPVLATPGKLRPQSPLGFDGLARACRATDRPIWALGGLKPGHARDALATGARGIAALSGIFGERDPSQAVREYLAALARAQ